MPTSNAPPSIGSNLKKLKLISEEHDLPPERKQVVSFIGKLLEQGGVQRLTLQVGQPIRLSRYVKANSLDPIKDLAQDDLYEAIRLSAIEETPVHEGANPYQVLFDLFGSISHRGKVPKAFLVNSIDRFKSWLGRDPSHLIKEAYGVPIETNAEVPDDVCLMACADPDDTEIVTFTLKFNMEVPVKKKAKKS